MNELDQILNSDKELVPSNRFVSAVMDSIRDEQHRATMPGFPWRRLALAGMGGVICAAMTFLMISIFPMLVQGDVLTQSIQPWHSLGSLLPVMGLGMAIILTIHVSTEWVGD